MNAKHRRTLAAVFTDPTPTGIRWQAIESLFVAAGGDVSEGKGSRVRVALNGVRAVFHRPHPGKETKRSAVRSVRRFLAAAGVTTE